MAEYTSLNVQLAINALFQIDKPYTVAEAKQADKFLKDFEKSPQAWPVTIQMLINPTITNTTVNFTLTRILKSKLQYDYLKLNQEEITQIQQSCQLIIKKYHHYHDRSVRLQVSLMLIYLYMRQYNSFDLLNFILNDLNIFGTSSENTKKFFYEVLESFPDELLDDEALIIDQADLNKLQTIIKEQTLNQIIILIEQLWKSSDPTDKYNLLKCLTKWNEFAQKSLSEDERVVLINQIEKTAILQESFNLINSEELQDKAIRLIISVISIIPKSKNKLLLRPNVPQELEVHNRIVYQTFTKLIESFPNSKQALKDDLGDEIQAYIMLYTKIGKKFVSSILYNQELYVAFFQGFLEVFNHQNSDEYIQEMANLWIKVINCINEDHSILPNFLKLFEELFKILVQKTTLSIEFYIDYDKQKHKDQEDIEEGEDLDIQNNNEEDEIKQKCRDYCQDILKEFTKIIPAREILLILVSVLKSQNVMIIMDHKGLQFQQLPKNVQQGQTIFEACILLINSLAQVISESNDQQAKQYLQDIVQLYIDLQIQHPFIIGKLLKNLKNGSGNMCNDQLLNRIFEFVYIYFDSQVSQIQKQATSAFHRICKSNKDFVNKSLPQFFEMIKNKQHIKNFDNIVKGVSIALSENQTSLFNNLVPLCYIFAQNLAQLKQQQPPTKQTFKDIKKNLDYLTFIFSGLSDKQGDEYKWLHELVVQIYKELWPLLSYFVESYSMMTEVIPEKIVRLTKHTWRCSFDSFPLDFLTEVFRLFLKVYNEVPISSFIYAAEVGSTVFYKYSAYRDLLQQAFEKICEITFTHLPKFANLEDNPELSEDFFGVLVRYGRYTPDLLIKSESMKSTIMELSMMGIGIEHKLVAKSLYAWLEVLCKLLWKNVQDQVFKGSITEEQRQSLLQTVKPYIQSMFYDLMKAIREGKGDNEVIDYIIDVIQAIAFIEEINYGDLVKDYFEQPQGLMSQNEIQQWISLAREKQLNKKWMEKQQEWLETYAKRSNQILLRS